MDGKPENFHDTIVVDGIRFGDISRESAPDVIGKVLRAMIVDLQKTLRETDFRAAIDPVIDRVKMVDMILWAAFSYVPEKPPLNDELQRSVASAFSMLYQTIAELNDA